MSLIYRKIKTSLLLALLSISFLALNGCILAAGAAGGGATMAYIKGNYSMNIDSSSIDAYNAAVKTIQDNDAYLLVSREFNEKEQSAEIYGVTKLKSNDFYIEITKLTASTCKITIKFGTFGDQAQSSTLMDMIQETINKSK